MKNIKKLLTAALVVTSSFVGLHAAAVVPINDQAPALSRARRLERRALRREQRRPLESHLRNAITRGDLPVLRDLVSPASVDTIFKSGDTVLHWVVKKAIEAARHPIDIKQLEDAQAMCRWLISEELANRDIKDRFEKSPLDLVLEGPSLVRALLRPILQPDARGLKFSLEAELHIATKENNVELVRYLIGKGVDANIDALFERPEIKSRPLHLAVKNAVNAIREDNRDAYFIAESICKILKVAGARTDKKDTEDKAGKTPHDLVPRPMPENTDEKNLWFMQLSDTLKAKFHSSHVINYTLGGALYALARESESRC